jgi:hypothetical protein
MDPLFAWIEQSALGVWVRESDSLLAFPGIISVHAIGLALVAGTCAAIDLRLLGFLPRVPVAALKQLLPVVWVGLALNVASGVTLVVAYPTKALTNPLFYYKLTFIALGLVILVVIRNTVLPAGSVRLAARTRALAAVSLASWGSAIAAGRLLAYTCTRLMVDFGTCT